MPGQEAAEQSLIDFLNSDPEQVSFGRAVAGMLAYDDGVVQISEQEVRDAIEEYKRTAGEFVKAMNISDSEIRKEVLPKLRNSKEVRLMEGGRYNPSENPNRPEMIEGYAEGGEASFPDLSGDGKTTYKDVLIGRGVKLAEGGEVDQMLAEVQESPVEDEAAAMGMLEGSRQDFEILEQIIQVVMNLMQQGFTEGEIIALLKEQGLDDEDAKTAVEYAKEVMGQAQQAGQAEQDIGAQLAALG